MQLRKTNTSVGQITVRAFVRGYRADEIIGLIVAGDSEVVISPSGLGTFGLPPINGFVVASGIIRRIMSVAPLYMAGQLVRADLQVRG